MIVYVTRDEWGATTETERFIRDRFSVGKLDKTTIQVHHTASIDGRDRTPNRWTYEGALRYMRSLQWARPDLGPLPYSENVAVSEDLSTVWIFEGRGLLKVGAHTADHNRDGIGSGVFGNFDLGDTAAAELAVRAIESRSRNLRSVGYHRLGSVLNPRGWEAWGHRDSSPKSCPGDHLYPLLSTFTLTPPPEEDDPMLTKHLSAEGWRQLYREGHASAPSEEALIDYWITHAAARSDNEHAIATLNIEASKIAAAIKAVPVEVTARVIG